MPPRLPQQTSCRYDFGTYAPEVLKSFLQRDNVQLPIEMFGGGSTLSMTALAAFVLLPLGNSLYAATMVFALASYVSQVLIFHALRPEFAAGEQRYVLIGATLLPSAVFWSCAVLKEPGVMAALGPTMLGLRWFSEGHRRPLAVGLVLPAALVMAMLKPYVLMALSVSAAVFYLRRRFAQGSRGQLRPITVIVAFAVGYGGLVLGNRYFSKASDADESAAALVARQRRVSLRSQGGSNYNLEGSSAADDPEERSFVQELALAPLALFTALFRPLLFEARNAVQLANALEATALLLIALQLLRRLGVRGLAAEVSRSPTLVFCLVFTLALGVGTGLATSNLGTLSRYRAPMMPFFFTMLLVLRSRAAVRRARASGLVARAPTQA